MLSIPLCTQLQERSYEFVRNGRQLVLGPLLFIFREKGMTVLREWGYVNPLFG